MATPVHCLYCFEVLSASLENRKALTLSQVQKSYSEYLVSAPPEKKQIPALRRLADASDSSSASSSSSSTSSLSLSSSTPVTSLSSTPSLPAEEGEDAEPQQQQIEEDDDNKTDDDDDDDDDDSDRDLPLPGPGSSSVSSSSSASSSSPLFVTWNILHPRHGHVLRGCIGTFEPQPLEDGLSSYALISALQDMRFNPVSLKELPSLQVAVTLLTDFEDASDPMDWELGTHGIRISFSYHGKRYGSTYLPDVAVEQGWDKEETMTSLMRKAGWMGRKDKWREVDLKVVRYQGRKEGLEYAEFKKWRDWVVGNKKVMKK